MNEDEDLELRAIQNQLDDAFATTRPRRGFEDELWLRLQSRRPFWRRLADGLGGLTGAVRELPSVPASAVAAVLIVLIGASAVTFGVLHLGQGAPSTATTSQGQDSTRFGGAAAPLASGFGPVPAPSLAGAGSSPTDLASPDQASSPKAVSRPENLYFGAAHLTWAGRLDVVLTQAPVFRYQEPDAAFVSQFAGSLNATAVQGATSTGFGSYAGQGFTISLRGSSGTPPSEPFYVLAPTKGAAVPTGTDPAAVAAKYLDVHNLALVWSDTVVVDTAGDQTRVKFLRILAMPGGAPAYLVDGSGDRYGAEVDLSGGRPVRAAGPMPVQLESIDYPIISANAAVASAVASGASGTDSIAPVPSVQLTSAELVYALAWAGDHSFYEPAFLFSGSFDYNGTKYVKRVLVPAVDPAYRSS